MTRLVFIALMLSSLPTLAGEKICEKLDSEFGAFEEISRPNERKIEYGIKTELRFANGSTISWYSQKTIKPLEEKKDCKARVVNFELKKLFTALGEGNDEEAAAILKVNTNYSVNDRDPENGLVTGWQWALMNGHFEIIQELKNMGANFDLPFFDGSTIWSRFLALKDDPSFDFLATAVQTDDPTSGNKVKDFDGESSLDNEARKREFKTQLEALLASGVPPIQLDTFGRPSYFYSSSLLSYKILRSHSGGKVSVDNTGNSYFDFVLTRGSRDLILHLAGEQQKDSEALEKILKKCVFFIGDFEGFSDKADLLNSLGKSGVPISSRGIPFYMQVYFENHPEPEVIEYLLKYESTPLTDKQASDWLLILLNANSKAHVKYEENLARFLIRKVKNLNYQDELGNSPLHYIAKNNLLSAYDEFTKNNKAPAILKNKKNQTALLFAMEGLSLNDESEFSENDFVFYRLLNDTHFKLDEKDLNQSSAYDYAVRSPYHSFLYKLSRPLDANFILNNGRPLLLQEAMNLNTDNMALLIKVGARTDWKNAEGQSLLQIIEETIPDPEDPSQKALKNKALQILKSAN